MAKTKVFISWSGDLSHQVAKLLKNWLPTVLQSTDPWLSSVDISAGTNWSLEIRTALEESAFGIVVTTTTNADSSWMNFEAGALAKHLDESRVVPVLVNLDQTDLKGPLATFQSVKCDRSGLEKLVHSINTSGSSNDDQVSEEILKITLEKMTEQIVNSIKEKVEKLDSSVGNQPEQRSQEDILDEILIRTREIQRNTEQLGVRHKDLEPYNQLASESRDFAKRVIEQIREREQIEQIENLRRQVEDQLRERERERE